VLLGGRYRLEREIGRGGMGVVWLGRDEVLGRSVALKRLAPDASGREAQLAARLHHPHVVAVFDLVDDPSEGRWLVMEYVAGTTLAGLVQRQGPQSPAAAAGLLVQVAAAVAAAKAAGITHRDVKPSNVLVTADGVAKLSDFGIARATGDTTMTRTGLLLGSPAYVAPEVAAGERAGHASDVWSLGATAYFLLTGTPPYSAGEGGTALTTLYRIVHEDPPRAAGTGWLDRLLDHTLVKDPSRRWSIEQVHGYLQDRSQAERVDTESTRALAPVSPAAPVHRWRRWSRVHTLVLAVVVALGLALGGYAGLSGGSHSPSSAADRQHPVKAAEKSSKAATPTAAGMEAFIGSYVDAVSTNPAAAWTMLTPKFQRESGGFAKYEAFWSPARNGRIRGISANPSDLVVSYFVHFAHFDNGPGPTVLQLVHRDGRYLIDGETSRGFVPAR
jgi:serine/threonine protein kinase